MKKETKNQLLFTMILHKFEYFGSFQISWSVCTWQTFPSSVMGHYSLLVPIVNYKKYKVLSIMKPAGVIYRTL